KKELETKCKPDTVSEECNAVRLKIQQSLEGLNVYDIYRECPKKEGPKFTRYDAHISTLKKIKHQQRAKLDFLDDSFGLDEQGIWPSGCKEDPYPLEFFNDPETKKKLHVRPEIVFQNC